ncbi:MAG: FtsQ-type POTRA domain-containing protein [Verrucomicrobia bacterium]|nr:FtsQ-type POTRA domain-containing protein [Verrucomicrobiota bacterium]MDE3047152.1 FtsQ-type POTRA domain-containing protein [Verrucomicrobiota bacterium]
MKGDWTMRQALFCLVGSCCATLIIGLTGIHFWNKLRHERLRSEKYQIRAIIQTGPEKEALKTLYLAELLGLSSDQPQQLYALNVQQAEKALKSSPLIADAKVKRMPPSTLYIDYEVRKPVAWLADFKNTAVDAKGHVFPVAPFLSPKRMPEIYLGSPSIEGWRVEGPAFSLAMEIFQFLEKAPWTEGLIIQRIDVSNAFAPSLGMREVVVITEEEVTLRKGAGELVCVFPKILRLAPKDYQQQLGHFFSLRRSMMEDYKRQLATIQVGGRFAPRIIDLRIPQLAFVEKS